MNSNASILKRNHPEHDNSDDIHFSDSGGPQAPWDGKSGGACKSFHQEGGAMIKDPHEFLDDNGIEIVEAANYIKKFDTSLNPAIH